MFYASCNFSFYIYLTLEKEKKNIHLYRYFGWKFQVPTSHMFIKILSTDKLSALETTKK